MLTVRSSADDLQPTLQLVVVAAAVRRDGVAATALVAEVAVAAVALHLYDPLSQPVSVEVAEEKTPRLVVPSLPAVPSLQWLSLPMSDTWQVLPMRRVARVASALAAQGLPQRC